MDCKMHCSSSARSDRRETFTCAKSRTTLWPAGNRRSSGWISFASTFCAGGSSHSTNCTV